MIFLLATQGIGEEWGRHRHLRPRHDYVVLSQLRHVDAVHPDPAKDRVIEVGPGPHAPSHERIVGALKHKGFPEDQIEWEPVAPYEPPPPPQPGFSNHGGWMFSNPLSLQAYRLVWGLETMKPNTMSIVKGEDGGV